MDKITIERETLERAVDILDRRLNWNPVVDKLCSEINAALAAQPADIVNPISQQEPVAWRHSKTGRLYDSEEEVSLADGDEWAEPLYAAPVAQQEPSAWRQWSTKQHDWDYQTNRGDLRPDALAEPLFVAAAQPGAIEQALQKIADFGQEQEQKPVAWIGLPGKGTPLFTAPPAPAAVPPKLWLWKNFVDGRPEYWAFDNPFPVHMDCGDPQTLGEPCGYAIFKPSRQGRTDVSEAEVLRRIASARVEKPVAMPLTDAQVDAISMGLFGCINAAYRKQITDAVLSSGGGGITCATKRTVAQVRTATSAGTAAVPTGYALVPIEPTRKMVEAYLSANSAYWERIDAMPTKIGVWRNGTPKEATEVSYRAMIAAAGDKP